MQTPEIDVVMATFNGARFLSEQIESISRQHGVRVNLIVSDDGSSDQTRDILKNYQNQFNSLQVYQGPRGGPSENFFYLLTLTKSSFVALSDQDDVWEPNHLISSISELRVYKDVAALRFTKTRAFNSNGSEIIVWPLDDRLPSFTSSTMENTARGCTFVLNKKAIDLINSYKPEYAVMHDWWIFLQIRINGKVIFSPIPEVHYRIHPGNFVGHGHKNQRRKLRSFSDAIKGKWKPLLQAKELLELNAGVDNVERRHLENLVSIASRDYFQRCPLVVLKLPKLRSDPYSEVAARLLLLMHRKYEIRPKSASTQTH